jgi:hypothetical protein
VAWNELEIKRNENILNKFIERRRPPAEIRDQVDLGYRIANYSIEIFEVRPSFSNKNVKTEIPVAKATYVSSGNTWKIYWKRADLKWHSYEPHPHAKSLEEWLTVVDEDEYSCFWG